MVAAAQPGSGSPDAAAKRRLFVETTVGGDLRFLSHRDELRVLTRALVRAEWPLAYTQGFNPRPRVVMPLPRAVGTAAECQVAVVDLADEASIAALGPRLAAQLPADLAVCRVSGPGAREMPHARAVDYSVPLAAGDVPRMAASIAALLRRETVVVSREMGPGKPRRAVDIRPFVETLAMTGAELRMRIGLIAQRSARPAEVLTELELDPEAYVHQLRRVAVEWDIELTGPARPAWDARN
jgi:radical SAM-linked protein